ncbi:MAG: Ca-activated chloride channel [Blastocatellia bacterium]|jgi:VWFA-related protein|nr:Ca-activated chloride channel [Blastocatellia bacterium]
MRPANRCRFICSLIGLSILTFCLGGNAGRAQESEGVRADLPENGNLRVENLRGSVTIEVWNESYVSIAAISNGQLSRTAAVIERTERLLSVRVATGASTDQPGVSLAVRMPARARAAIITGNGIVKVHDLPSALLVQTQSGPIYAEFPQIDFDLTAASRRGTIDSTLPTLSGSGKSGTVHVRLGDGSRTVRLNSDTGGITLMPSRVHTARSTPLPPRIQRVVPDDLTERRAPRLVGGNERAAPSQTPATPSSSPEEISEGDVIRVDTQLASVNVSVIDRGTNRGVVGLKRTDFRLFEDGVEQKIAQFESSAAPFNLVLLIDLSGSTSDVIDLIRTAALHFVDAARPFDRIAVITFAGTQVIVSPLTTDRVVLRERINAIAQPKGSTKLYDSIAFAMEQGFKEFKGSGRNAIVLLSDGLDSTLPNVMGEGSTRQFSDVLRAAQEFDGVIYSLWVDTQIWEPASPNDIQNETIDLAADRMEDVSNAGGGVFHEVLKLEDLAGVYDRVVADLGTVYTLAYRPTNKVHDGKWRAVRVTVNRPNTVARGKRGYYAN